MGAAELTEPDVGVPFINATEVIFFLTNQPYLYCHTTVILRTRFHGFLVKTAWQSTREQILKKNYTV